MAHAAPSLPLASSARLTRYGHPPLVEVALSACWNFTGRLDEPAGQALLDRLGPAWQLPSVSEPTHAALPQSWSRPAAVFQSVLGEQRLELSGDGLEYTWDGRDGEVYPRYEAVRDGFVISLDAWQDWLTTTGQQPPVFSGWKVSYLNRIPQSTVWTSLSDCGFFRLLSPLPPALPRLDRCEGHWQFALDRDDAALTCDLKTTSGTTRDPRACLWLRLTCTGGTDGGESSVLEGLDYGRMAIVSTFRQLMSPAANAYWELQREA